MPASKEIKFTDNPAVLGREAHYASLRVDTAKVLASWKQSLFSFEWLRPDGSIKDSAELSPPELEKRRHVENALAQGAPVPKPVLGIGIMENVEIGIGRAEFLTLAAHGALVIEAHVPASNREDFKDFIAEVD